MKPLACDFYELYNITHTCRIANHLYNIHLELFHAFNYYWNNEADEALAQTFANFMREFELTRK